MDGIQTDFDDGHCPTWHNQIRSWYNIYLHVHGMLDNVPGMEQSPVLMMRPRAWNMIDHNISVDGKKAAGPLIDFGLLMFHYGTGLYLKDSVLAKSLVQKWQPDLPVS